MWHNSTEIYSCKLYTGNKSPSLRELDRLPLTAEWYRLGLQLGVRADDLDAIECNYPRDANMCKIKMFAQWLRGDTNPSFEGLVRAITSVGKRDLAESLCRAKSKFSHLFLLFIVCFLFIYLFVCLFVYFLFVCLFVCLFIIILRVFFLSLGTVTNS